MVNHFEGAGVKVEKYGPPDRSKLAKEIMDLFRCGLQIAIHYGVEHELESKINESYEGLIRSSKSLPAETPDLHMPSYPEYNHRRVAPVG